MHVEPEPSGYEQWKALTARTLWKMFTRGEIIAACLLPLVFTLGFYLPLKYVMSLGPTPLDYGQYVMAIVVLQTMSFTMMSAAQRAAVEARTGLADRIKTMPVKPFIPMASRIFSGFVRSIISLAAAIGFGYMIGFRLHAGIWQAVGFVAFSLMVGLTLSLGADGIGTLAPSPAALSQALTLPTLIFGMLSTGFIPESGFPSWIRPVVRNQPISHFAAVLRDMAGDGVTFHVLWPAIIWLGALFVVCSTFAIWANGRRA